MHAPRRTASSTGLWTPIRTYVVRVWVGLYARLSWSECVGRALRTTVWGRNFTEVRWGSGENIRQQRFSQKIAKRTKGISDAGLGHGVHRGGAEFTEWRGRRKDGRKEARECAKSRIPFLSLSILLCPRRWSESLNRQWYREPELSHFSADRADVRGWIGIIRVYPRHPREISVSISGCGAAA